jgi:Protein of unknown function (DUF2914)
MENKMKGTFYQTGVLLVLAVIMAVIPIVGQADNESSLLIARASICNSIVEHEPLDIGTTFTNNVDKLYCFSEILGATTKTHISHVWYYKGVERARKQLRVHDARWRTYSSKLIQSYETGTWEVKILDAQENLLQTLKFNITPK